LARKGEVGPKGRQPSQSTRHGCTAVRGGLAGAPWPGTSWLTRRHLLTAVLLAAGLGAVGWAVLGSPDDDEVIRSQLHRLAETVAIHEGENVLLRRARLDSAFSDLVSENVSASLPELGAPVRGRAALVGLATAAGLRANNASLRYVSMELQLNAKIGVAHADTHVAVLAAGGREGLQGTERNVQFELIFRNGTWLIDGILVSGPQR
jgi:hypothetical protein